MEATDSPSLPPKKNNKQYVAPDLISYDGCFKPLSFKGQSANCFCPLPENLVVASTSLLHPIALLPLQRGIVVSRKII